MKRTTKFIAITMLLSLVAVAAACGNEETAPGSDMKKITDKKVSENLTVTLSNDDGKLKNGGQEIMLAFTDGEGKPLDITAASLNFNMPAMGSMAEMNNAAALNTTSTPGLFKGNVTLDMAGEWIAQVSYEGAETGKTTISMTAQ